MIRIENLHKYFGSVKVLQGLNLKIEDRRTTTVLGLSGSGKSTILKHIVGLMKPTRGKIYVDDEEITGMNQDNLDRVRLKFGVVFQNAALLQSLTVFENVALPLREHRKYTPSEVQDRVAGKLRLLRLVETDWNKLPAELSGGMRKRVGLARAIIEDPAYILWDEPTTGLDPITNNMVHDMIIEARDELGVTSMVISHDVSGSCRVSDDLAILYKGKILEEGPPDQVMNTSNPIVRQLLSGDVVGPITDDDERYRFQKEPIAAPAEQPAADKDGNGNDNEQPSPSDGNGNGKANREEA